MAEVNLTLEGLYDILRNEKSREDLQELPQSFYVDVTSYLREKKTLLAMRKDEDELFANSERKKLEYELRSIKRILKEIYQKREKKIIDIALNKSRTRSDIIDTSYMLLEEKFFFEKITQIFDQQRVGVLLKLFKGELPMIKDIDTQKKGVTLKTEIKTEEKEIKLEKKESEVQIEKEALKTKVKAKKEEGYGDMVGVKFIHHVPRFIWKDMKEYGPFKAGEETKLYYEIVDLLQKKGRAEMV